MNAKELAISAAVLTGVGVVLYVLLKREAAAAAQAVGQAINPASDQNMAYRGVNSVGAVLTGDPSWSLGSWLYDLFNPPYDPNASYAPRKLRVGAESQVWGAVAQGTLQ